MEAFCASPQTLYDRIGEYRPDNLRIHVDLKHYLIGSTADPAMHC